MVPAVRAAHLTAEHAIDTVSHGGGLESVPAPERPHLHHHVAGAASAVAAAPATSFMRAGSADVAGGAVAMAPAQPIAPPVSSVGAVPPAVGGGVGGVGGVGGGEVAAPIGGSGVSVKTRVNLHLEKPLWERPPVIVGGTDGSGTRGCVTLLLSQGVLMLSDAGMYRKSIADHTLVTLVTPWLHSQSYLI